MAHVAPEIYGGAFKTNPALAAEYAQKMVKSKGEYKTCDRGYKYQQAAICWWSSLWFLHTIKQPTLLLRGDDDPLINPINMQVMGSLMPNSSLYTVRNGGHLFLLTHLDEVIPIIVEFLK
jgi:pimeloyl-ACP methyl ester carboxylesterase